MAIDFGELASRYASNRLDQAMQPFTDPEAYMNQRMTNDFGVDMNGNTKPVSTTINYGENGTPETITTKREVGQSQPQEYSAPANYALPTPQGGGLGIQAPQYAAPVGVPQPQQAMPQAVNPQQ
jgi:hypothetical protein